MWDKNWLQLVNLSRFGCPSKGIRSYCMVCASVWEDNP